MLQSVKTKQYKFVICHLAVIVLLLCDSSKSLTDKTQSTAQTIITWDKNCIKCNGTLIYFLMTSELLKNVEQLHVLVWRIMLPTCEVVWDVVL